MWHPWIIFLILAFNCNRLCNGKILIYSRDESCQLKLVESIPEKLTYNSTISHVTTYEAYSWLVKNANDELNFASLYWTLRGKDIQPGGSHLASKGEALFKAIANVADNVKMKLAYNFGGMETNLNDIQDLSRRSNFDAVGLNFTKFFGAGVLHTKAVIADKMHAYLGSSNMDWRSLTQIKELGILLIDCPTLVNDLNKLFEVYFMTGKHNQVPSSWPKSVIGSINATHPWLGNIGGNKYSIYFGASPSAMCPPQRSRDIDAIISTIHAAKKFVHVAVMDYGAKTTNYRKRTATFWPTIDNALRDAAFRGVHVRLLVSHWKHSDKDMTRFVNSLTALNHSKVLIEGKFFTVPAFDREQAAIPFARVNHNKYLVTESTAVICTSNWDGAYFSSTAGIAMSITDMGNSGSNQKSIVTQVQDLFMRDWNSGYSHWKPTSDMRGN